MENSHINKQTRKKLWKLEQRKFLLDNAGKLTLAELAKALNKTEEAVRKKASKSGISIKVKS